MKGTVASLGAQVAARLGDQALSLLTISLLLVGTMALAWLLRSPSRPQFPLVGEELGNVENRRRAFVKDGIQLYRKGYRTFKDKIFRLTTWDGERVVVPMRVLDELRKLSDEDLNNVEMIEKSFEMDYTGRIGDNVFMAHMIRADLTRNLNRITPNLAKEVELTVNERIGACEDWTSVIVYPKMLEVVAIVSGLIFLGPEVNHEPEYMYSAIHYTVDVFAAARQLKRWHPLIRPIGTLFCKELSTLREHRKNAIAFLMPYIEERRRILEAGGALDDCMLNWMLQKADSWKMSNKKIAEVQLSLSVAAIHTTTRAVTNILYDLAVMPELRNELRSEIDTVIERNGGALVSTVSLFQLKLLDSVMRESQRINTNSEIRFNRVVKRPITLKDGTKLSPGTVIEAAFGAIVNDEELYPGPERYDQYRFLNLRDRTVPDPIQYTNKENFQYVAATKEFMGFGYGRHACPGRFFAANEIKLIIAHILLTYDFQMPDEKAGIENRYKPVVNAATSLPNTKNSIILRRRQIVNVPTTASASHKQIIVPYLHQG
ncbi:hypothetical protein KCU73_g2196, partial [Aureobasidium melanogenum]